jgi:hypothetical protein
MFHTFEHQSTESLEAACHLTCCCWGAVINSNLNTAAAAAAAAAGPMFGTTQ